MFSLVHKRLSQIDQNCSKVHGYLVKLAMGKSKEKPFSKESERKLQKMIAAITEARDMLNDLLEENEKNWEGAGSLRERLEPSANRFDFDFSGDEGRPSFCHADLRLKKFALGLAQFVVSRARPSLGRAGSGRCRFSGRVIHDVSVLSDFCEIGPRKAARSFSRTNCLACLISIDWFYRKFGSSDAPNYQPFGEI
jgi:hypothetical protein